MHRSLLLLLGASSLAVAQQAVDDAEAAKIEYIDPPNGNSGWCYWCSTDDAPPLCNSQCLTAINRLAEHGDSTQALTDTEGNCTIKYMPQVYDMNRNGARQPGESKRIIIQSFTHILANCGKDASTPDSTQVDTSYCTTSGGGGTYGWLDDGTVLEDSARYTITTKGTDQCGQHKASWQDADKLIKWNPVWVPEGAQVKLDTNPPPLTGEMAAMATMVPQLNAECENEVCNLKQQPYYAHVPQDPWYEKGWDGARHRMVFEGWADDVGATAFQKSIQERCGEDPVNWQAYKNPDMPAQSVVDFNISDKPKTHCECLSWAVFDASGGGIELPETAFCPPEIMDVPTFTDIPDELRKRSFGRSLFKPVHGGPAPMIVPRAYR